MSILIPFYEAAVISVYRTVNQLNLRPVVLKLEVIVLVPLLFMMLILVAMHLLDSFCPHQLLCQLISTILAPY